MDLLDCFQKEKVTVPLFWGKIPENMSKKYLWITSNLTEEAKQLSGYDNSF